MGFRKMEIIDHQEHRFWLLKYHDRLRLYEELLNEAIVDAPINEARRDEDLRIRREREEKEDSRVKERQRFRDDRARVRERCEREKQARIGRNSPQTESGALVPSNERSGRIHTLSDISAKEAGSTTEDGDRVPTPHAPGSAV
ncbi:hypothetical protein L218DRAFT_375622 [Marasmius fiardii PR-910]|nr:hypothetical protein L218DRAFT_375622 [Marasmius fiardii PR-910]